MNFNAGIAHNEVDYYRAVRVLNGMLDWVEGYDLPFDGDPEWELILAEAKYAVAVFEGNRADIAQTASEVTLAQARAEGAAV